MKDLTLSSEQLKIIIHNGESATVEFKTSFQKEVIETIVAFSNAQGGSIFIGIKDSGEILGVTVRAETVQQYLNRIKQNTLPAVIPDIELINMSGKFILVIHCNEYPVKPVSFKGKYFKRVNNSNHQISPAEIAEMYLKSLNVSWDAHEYPKVKLDDLDINKINLFCKMINETGRFYLENSPFLTLEDLKEPNYQSQLRNN